MVEKKIKTCDCKAGKTHIGVGGGVLIFNEKKEILLMKRGKNAKNEAGWWSKPGGTVEYGEKVVTAMKREIKEEVGVDIDIWGYLPHTDHVIKKECQHWVAFNYLANIKKGTVKNLEPHKCEELKWFAVAEFPKKTVQNTREAIKNYQEKKYIKL
ncbi:MAG: MutT/NUDIX family protein [Candidatus Moranbacteria bacterium GW2011_GWC2_37_8]|nr:MAG: MutT/NUDIX family protein [Candidatus Moranbacteria bacterium GW2011_GWC2_37_8]KKQ62353.1 MAG: MutT/NUDIX family protein [Parcubacteria group bacterium GW2011_GWC1_38_22]KKQ81184.1 MAG: MutT/NUDIX family protein [Candidatus Moranbacteria bacterium GW2011_GWD2_38_7]